MWTQYNKIYHYLVGLALSDIKLLHTSHLYNTDDINTMVKLKCVYDWFRHHVRELKLKIRYVESIITDLEVKCLEQVPIFVNVKIKLLELTKKIDSYVKEVQDTANMLIVRIVQREGALTKHQSRDWRELFNITAWQKYAEMKVMLTELGFMTKIN